MPGSIKKRGKASYRVRVDAPPDVSGCRRQVSETVHGTKKDAEKRLAEMVVEIGSGKYTAHTNLTVADVVQTWLKKYRKGHADSTYDTAESLLRVHVTEKHGFLPVGKLTPIQVDAIMVGMLDAGDKPRTVRYVHWLLKNILEEAFQQNTIPYNPAVRVKPPRDVSREVPPLTDEQVDAVFREVRKTRLVGAFTVALGTGLRRGEILGLKWSDIDFEVRVLYVRRSYSKSGGHGTFTDGKTNNSRRTIPMTETVMAALREQKARQEVEKTKAGARWKEHDLVFPTKWGTPVHPDNLAKEYLHPALQRAGLTGIRLHQFRHTFATWCISKGIDIKKVSIFLGHYDVAFTYKKYHHVMPQFSVKEDGTDIEAAVFGTVRDQVVTKSPTESSGIEAVHNERPAAGLVAESG